MTREEAIKELKESLDTLREYDIAHSSRLKQALEMAIRTLENHDTFMKYAYSQGKQDALEQLPCDDAISRQELLGETIRKNSIWNSITNSEGKNLEEIIFELPPVNPQPSEHFIDGVHAIGYREGYKDAQKQKSGKWIPVSERLPEIDEEYHSFLVTYSNGSVGISEFYLTFIDLKPYWSGMVDVIAWMPLPKPYEPQESEKVNCKSIKCYNCINHNYCDFEPQESEEQE